MKRVLLVFLYLEAISAQNPPVPNVPNQPPPPPPTTTTPKPTVPPPPDYTKRPPQDVWPKNYDNGNNNRNILGDWLLTGSWQSNRKRYEKRPCEYEGYDGFYNNIARPDSGAIDRPLLRRWPAAYADGTYIPIEKNRPNPLELSDSLLAGEIGTQSRTGRSALFVFFGQQVVEEILDAQRAACPPEYFNIDIPKYHKYRKQPGHSSLPLLRTRFDQRTGLNPNNPRQQLNEITPYIDGGLFYGITKQWADQLRTNEKGEIEKDGLLASSYGGLFPAINTQRLPMANPPPPFYHSVYTHDHETAKVSRFFKLGNPRGNENAFLLTFGVLWFRWHNYVARIIKSHQPNWSSEEIFNEARKWVIATYQHIVVDEWLPALLNKTLQRYDKYDPSIDPQIDQFFQSAAFRFGHTLVTPGVYLRDYIRNGCKHRFDTWRQHAVRTCNIFWRPQEPLVTPAEADDPKSPIDIDRFLMGMSVQLCEEEDHKIVEDLRGNVFGPLEFPRRDLMAVNIQRGRDHGLPGFNDARTAFGLPTVKFSHFGFLDIEVQKNLTRLYSSPDDIDVWVGGILETMDGPGELFSTIIFDQFRRIRDGDRFWYENRDNGLFSRAEVIRIKQLRLYDVIMAVTKMDADDIPEYAFNVPSEYRGSHNKFLIEKCNLTTRECRFKSGYKFACSSLPALNQFTLNESCRQGDSFDYFRGSEWSFIGTYVFIVSFVGGCLGAVLLLIEHKKKVTVQKMIHQTVATRKSLHEIMKSTNPEIFAAQEWFGMRNPMRNVGVVFDSPNKQIKITCQQGSMLRAIDLSFENVFKIYTTIDQPYFILNSRHSYDLVLYFPSMGERQVFTEKLKEFIAKFQLEHQEVSIFTWKLASNIITTKEDRQKKLEMFYRVVFAQAFKIKHSKAELLAVSSNDKDIIYTEITMNEFAESLNMKPDNEFVRRMFLLADKDGNGFISFREFVGLLIIFAEGSEEQKARLLFKMYDINDTGILKAEDFESMIRCFLESVGGNIPENKLKKTIQTMLARADCDKKDELEFQDFLNILGKDIVNLNKARLGFKGLENDGSYLSTARTTIENIYGTFDIDSRFKGVTNENSIENADKAKLIDQEQHKALEDNEKIRKKQSKRLGILKYIELKSQQIFWLSLYTIVLIAIFVERAYHYSVEREHAGLRRIAGYGVTITRGAASAQMFTYSSLFLTMSRNLITKLRDTPANKYIPFDSNVDFHKYIACWAFFFTVLHIVGHAVNFYNISTQTADDLTCLFRNFFHATHELPKFHYWCWQTITGLTGVILTLIWILIYIFSLSFVRSKIYNWFWYMHGLYPLFYIFMILHGAGRLIQEPFFPYFVVVPAIIYTIDKLVSISRKKIEIPVVKAEILPSYVTMLEFQKPENFQYKSGQWVRIACMGLNKNEYHPFTLTSSPNEDTLKLHIRSVGPWTTHIRTIYEEAMMSAGTVKKLPKIYLDGPYGEGHQDWNNYDVSVLVGGGIGVTPFASILKDIISRSGQTRCKKVYFIWVSRTQKQFEWLIDIIREVENKDEKNLISCHIFITQFFEKFDLRMILLYVMERHYQRVANKSLFTNLKAVTHFGRPSFSKFFKTLQSLHEHTLRIGVFSCGPPSMTSSVNEACNTINFEGYHRFEHHYKNF